MSNPIPDGWIVQTLSDVATIGSSKRIMQSEYVSSGVPFFRSKEVIRRSKKLDISNYLYISRDRFEELRGRFGAPKPGEILVTAVGTIGVIYLVEDVEFYFKDGNLLWIREINKTISSNYLAKYLASDVFQKFISTITSGSRQAALTIEKLSELELYTPPLPEQQKIAAILSTVDDVIEKTRAQIDKLKDLKKGMMQELFTKGVGHTEFKDSPIGRIPVGWDVKFLGDIYPKIVVGYVGNVNDHYCEKNNGVPFYRTLNIRDGYIRHEPIKYVTEEFNTKNKKSQIFNDDILIARVGANLGMTCKVSNLECSANIANAIIIKSVKNASSNFYMEFIRSDYGQTQIMSEAAGGAQGVFNTKLAQGLVVPVPPLDEQVLIGSNLIAVDQNINLAEDKFSRFILIKKALMQDLLTGKVRVKIDDKESAVA
jgi:type I restriction enzyme S subunit